MNEDRVYIVSEGEYSDYRVVAVYTDKAAADEHAAWLGSRTADVEEFPVNRAPLRKTEHVVTGWVQESSMDGPHLRSKRDVLVNGESGVDVRPVRGHMWQGPAVWVEVKADTAERALKVWQEQVMRARAEWAVVTAGIGA